MSRLVQKFGGTSVADIERIQHVAKRVANSYKEGHQVAVVVSAMAGVTNQLLRYTQSLTSTVQSPEHDVVLASGEQVTCGLLALALQELGIPSRSYLSWQIGIETDDHFTQANILSVEKEKLDNDLNQGIVPVIAGFQGITKSNRLTTIGRGGSDTTAVAVAAALKADRCEIYTDVDGVYSADPRIVTKARKLSSLTFEEMFELASQGAKVLQWHAVEMAMKYGVDLRILTSFEEIPGTDIVYKRSSMEDSLVTGIAHTLDELKVSLIGVPDTPNVIADVFTSLSDAHIPLDMIVKNVSVDHLSDLTFTVPKLQQFKAQEIIQRLKTKYNFSEVLIDSAIAKISVVGAGMRDNYGVASLMFKTLAEKGITVQVISTSEIKIAVLVKDEYVKLALQSLHSAYDLDKERIS